MLTLSEERKFHLIFAHGSESSREWKYQGAKVRGNESSCYPGSRQFHTLPLHHQIT